MPQGDKPQMGQGQTGWGSTPAGQGQGGGGSQGVTQNAGATNISTGTATPKGTTTTETGKSIEQMQAEKPKEQQPIMLTSLMLAKKGGLAHEGEPEYSYYASQPGSAVEVFSGGKLQPVRSEEVFYYHEGKQIGYQAPFTYANVTPSGKPFFGVGGDWFPITSKEGKIYATQPFTTTTTITTTEKVIPPPPTVAKGYEKTSWILPGGGIVSSEKQPFGAIPGTWQATQMPANTFMSTSTGQLYSVDISKSVNPFVKQASSAFISSDLVPVSGYLWSPPTAIIPSGATIGAGIFTGPIFSPKNIGTRQDANAPINLPGIDTRTMLSAVIPSFSILKTPEQRHALSPPLRELFL